MSTARTERTWLKKQNLYERIYIQVCLYTIFRHGRFTLRGREITIKDTICSSQACHNGLKNSTPACFMEPRQSTRLDTLNMFAGKCFVASKKERFHCTTPKRAPSSPSVTPASQFQAFFLSLVSGRNLRVHVACHTLMKKKKLTRQDQKRPPQHNHHHITSFSEKQNAIFVCKILRTRRTMNATQ